MTSCTHHPEPDQDQDLDLDRDHSDAPTGVRQLEDATQQAVTALAEGVLAESTQTHLADQQVQAWAQATQALLTLRDAHDPGDLDAVDAAHTQLIEHCDQAARLARDGLAHMHRTVVDAVARLDVLATLAADLPGWSRRCDRHRIGPS